MDDRGEWGSSTIALSFILSPLFPLGHPPERAGRTRERISGIILALEVVRDQENTVQMERRGGN